MNTKDEMVQIILFRAVKNLGVAQTHLLFEKSNPKTFIKTACLCGFRWVKAAMAKKCHLSKGQLYAIKC
ncbi:MAG: hypothetical protein AB7E42_00970 [Anaerotignaceae bacterium]